MITHLFCVYDSKLGQFNNPLSFPSRGVAIRSFTDEVNRVDPNNNMSKYSDDFSFYYLGTFETEDGTFAPQYPPELVVRASDVVVS